MHRLPCFPEVLQEISKHFCLFYPVPHSKSYTRFGGMGTGTMPFTVIPSFQLFLRRKFMSSYNPQLIGFIQDVKDFICSFYIERISL